MLTVLGVLLLLVPCLLLLLCKDKRVGFLLILLGWLAFHLVGSFGLQALGIFKFSTAFGWVVIGVLLTGAVLWEKRNSLTVPTRRSVEWPVAVVAFIAIVSLSFVHYNYSGDMQFQGARPQVVFVSNESYPYPYYADEWYSVAYMERAIETGRLAVTNPFWVDGDELTPSITPNISAPYHGLLAHLILVLDLDPLFHHTVLSILFNTLLVLVLYVLIRSRAGWVPASVGALSVLYIANSGNLPTLWTLLPFTLGLLCFWASVALLLYKKPLGSLAGSVVAFVFYPPLVVFFAVLAGAYFFMNKPNDRMLVRKSLIWLGAVVATSFLLVAMLLAVSNSAHEVISFLSSKLVFNHLPDHRLSFPLFSVIPWWVVMLAVPGLVFVYNKLRWFGVVVLFSIGLWVLYSLIGARFLIALPRVVYLVAILAVVVAGFGLQYVFDFVLSHKKKGNSVTYALIGALALFFFTVGSFFSTDDIRYRDFVLTNKTTGEEARPAPLANQNYTEADRAIFENLEGARFLSVPWKGTVVGVSTGAVPVVVKTGTVGYGIRVLEHFSKADCAGRHEIALRRSVEYVYLPFLGCEGFEPVAESPEGYVLQRVVK